MGAHNDHLRQLSSACAVKLSHRGNMFHLQGSLENVTRVRSILEELYVRLEKHDLIDIHDVDTAIRIYTMQDNGDGNTSLGHYEKLAIDTRRKKVLPRTPGQARYLEALQTKDLVFGLGPAGTGKTYLAVAMGVFYMLSGRVKKLIISRPAVEAGESLGFLPGDLKEKVDPYLRPIYDALGEMLTVDVMARKIAAGEIEIAPLAFMRGRTLKDAYIILDEAQNTTAVQMKMFLTRLGENARMVVTGDLTQVDLPRGVRSGLRDPLDFFGKIAEVAFIKFDDKDVVRHPLVGKIVDAYDQHTTSKYD